MKFIPQTMIGARKRRGAFSLVEVVLSIGVAAFALISIISLLPLGIRSTGESVDESRAVNLLSSIILDRQASAYSGSSAVYGVAPLTGAVSASGTGVFGLSDQDSPTGTDLAKARYRVSYVVTSPSNGRPDPYQIWFRVSWPANNSSNAASAIETVAAFPQP